MKFIPHLLTSTLAEGNSLLRVNSSNSEPEPPSQDYWATRNLITEYALSLRGKGLWQLSCFQGGVLDHSVEEPSDWSGVPSRSSLVFPAEQLTDCPQAVWPRREPLRRNRRPRQCQRIGQAVVSCSLLCSRKSAMLDVMWARQVIETRWSRDNG